MRVPAGEQRDPGGEGPRERDVGAVEAGAAVGERCEMRGGSRLEPIGAERVGGEHEDVRARVIRGAVRARRGEFGQRQDGGQRDARGGEREHVRGAEALVLDGAPHASGQARPTRGRSREKERDGGEGEERDARRAHEVRSDHLDGAAPSAPGVPRGGVELGILPHRPELERGVQGDDHPHVEPADSGRAGTSGVEVRPKVDELGGHGADRQADGDGRSDERHGDAPDLVTEATLDDGLDLVGLGPEVLRVVRRAPGGPGASPAR